MDSDDDENADPTLTQLHARILDVLRTTARLVPRVPDDVRDAHRSAARELCEQDKTCDKVRTLLDQNCSATQTSRRPTLETESSGLMSSSATTSNSLTSRAALDAA